MSFRPSMKNRLRSFALLLLGCFLAAPLAAQSTSNTPANPRPQLVVGIGHRQNLMAVAFSPDGATVASGGLDKTVKLWDVRTGALKQTISGFKAFIDKIEFSPDGKSLNVTGSGAGVGEAVSCDLQTGALTNFESSSPSVCPGEHYLLALSPDGKLAVCRRLGSEAPNADLLIVWDTQANKPKFRLENTGIDVPAAAFSPDGKTIVIHHQWSPLIQLRDAQSGALLHKREDRIFGGFSPNGQTSILLDRPHILELWDARLQTRKAIVESTGWQHAISPDGQTIATVTKKGEIILLDATTGEIKSRSAAAGETVGLAFSSDSTTLSSFSQDGIARSWDSRTGKLKLTLNAAGRIKPDRETPLAVRDPDAPKDGLYFTSAVFSPDGQVIASILVSSVVIWDLRAGQIHQTRSENRWRKAAEFVAEGTIIEINGGIDPTVQDQAIPVLWDMRTLQPKLIAKSDINTILVSSVIKELRSPDSHTLVKLNQALNSAQLFDAQTGKQLGPSFKHSDAVSSFAFSPDGKFLLSFSGEPELGTNLKVMVLGNSASPKVSSSENAIADKTISAGIIKLWDARTSQLKLTLHCGGEISALAFLPDETRIVTMQTEAANDEAKSIKVWDSSSGQLVKTIKGDFPLFLSPDGRLALSNGQRANSVNVWDLSTGEIKWTLAETLIVPLFGPYFSPNGKLISTLALPDGNGMDILKLWDAQTGKLKRTLPVPPGSTSFSPDGKLLIVSSAGAARAWDIETGKQIWQLQMQENVVSPGLFSPDSRLMAVVDNDHTIKIQEAHSGRTLLILATFLTDTPGLFDWIVFTPAGYYAASPGAARYIRWRVGDKLLPAESYAHQFNRPDLVQKVVGSAR